MLSELSQEWTDGTILMQDTQVANDKWPEFEGLPYGQLPRSAHRRSPLG
jgi:hypothetical protein